MRVLSMKRIRWTIEGKNRKVRKIKITEKEGKKPDKKEIVGTNKRERAFKDNKIKLKIIKPKISLLVHILLPQRRGK